MLTCFTHFFCIFGSFVGTIFCAESNHKIVTLSLFTFRTEEGLKDSPDSAEESAIFPRLFFEKKKIGFFCGKKNVADRK